jgi:hypothetical protein
MTNEDVVKVLREHLVNLRCDMEEKDRVLTWAKKKYEAIEALLKTVKEA